MADTEEAKAWISRYAANVRELDRLQDRLVSLRSRLEAPGAPTLSGMPHGGGYVGDTIGRDLAAVEDMEAKAQEIRDRSGVLYHEIDRTIDTAIKGKDYADRRCVLKCRYLDLFAWAEICEILFGRKTDFHERMDSYQRRMYKIHREALEELQIVVSAPGTKGHAKEEGE